MISHLHPSAQKGFSQVAEIYQKARPSYPAEITQWLQHTLLLDQHSKVIDLGAGTGKFIPYLQSITASIQAIEPIAEMLEQLRQNYPDIQCIHTDSRKLKIPHGTIDAVLCAQSFHWFADQASLKAIYQVLKPQATLGLIWNQRDTSFAWVKEIADLLLPFEGDTPRYHNGTWRDVFENSALFKFKSVKTYPLKHTGTVEQVVLQRLASTSFIAASSKEQKQYIQEEVLKIIKKHLKKDLNDSIDFPYSTHAYHYQKR